MANLIIKPVNCLKGDIQVPGDKSISHRAIMIGALADGETIVHNFLKSADCLATADCFRTLGLRLTANGSRLSILGKGMNGLSKPNQTLDVGNSGTTIRLLSGILAGQSFESAITGDESIQKRPMKRIVKPLIKMGAEIKGRSGNIREYKGKNGEIFPPLTIKGGKLHGIEYKLPIASAQVKSCIILAGLFAKGTTIVVEPSPSRDHTERMLAYFGVPLKRFGNEVSIEGGATFEGREIFVPGDISSAAYLIVAGLLVPDSDLLIRNVGVNSTRTGILEVLHRMGANVEISDEEVISGEPRANIRISGIETRISSIEIKGEIIPKIIDEIPIIAVLATQANGDTIIKDAKELRVKESDRIKTTISELSKMGAKIEELPDGMIIHGKTKLHGAKIDSHGDHRIAMSCAIAGLIADGETIIENTGCIDTSFPGFEGLLKTLAV